MVTAGAAIGAAVGVVAGSGINKAIDFFASAPAVAGAAAAHPMAVSAAAAAPETAPPAVIAPTANPETDPPAVIAPTAAPETAPPAVIAPPANPETAPPAVIAPSASPDGMVPDTTDAPPVSGGSRTEKVSAAEFFAGAPPLQPMRETRSAEEEKPRKSAANPQLETGLDFFSASPMKPKRADDNFFAAAEMKSDKAGSPSAVSDDDDETQPKIARPLGYTPKDESAPSKSTAKHDEDEDDENEDKPAKKSKAAIPARRSFSGSKPEVIKKSTKTKSPNHDDEDDVDDEKPSKQRAVMRAS